MDDIVQVTNQDSMADKGGDEKGMREGRSLPINKLSTPFLIPQDMSLDVSLSVLVSEGVKEAFIVTLIARCAHLVTFTPAVCEPLHRNTSFTR